MSNLSQQFVFRINSGTDVINNSVSIPSTAVSPTGSLIFYSDKLKGDGYYGSTDGLHTVSYTVAPNFVGTCTIQASLTVAPGDGDWFDVDNSPVVYTRGANAVVTTTTNAVNFNGNFIWVRAKVHRDSALPLGSLLFVNYNH
jgi:hypothetical protein